MELSKEKDYYILKPNLKNAMIPKIIGSILTSLFFSLFVFLFSYSILQKAGLALIPPLIFFILLSGIPIFFFYMNLTNTEYRFFNDRIEYYEGWLTINRHTISYEKVTDIVMRKSIWDRLFNTATIGIVTAGTFSGSVYLPYLNEPERIYHFLQKPTIKKK